jgi:glycosyltransferase involved in cell wall biosynthesis
MILMARVGFVAIDQDNKWIGGRYYLHNLIKCNSLLETGSRLDICDVWWENFPKESDPFQEVRHILGAPVTTTLPKSLIGRANRNLRRHLGGYQGARDLFVEKDIDVFFPIVPCEKSHTPYVFWLPDFQYLRRPDLLSQEKCDYYESYFRSNVESASRVVLSSDDAKQDFIKVYPDLVDKARTIKFCSIPDENWWELNPSQVAKKYNLPERFFIVCNQFTKHKNHLTLVKALSHLHKSGQEDISIVCTGSHFDHRNENYIGQVKSLVVDHHLEKQIYILGMLPRSEQIALIRRSIAILQPSLFEGWSTVIEDAKTLGKVVIASNLPVNCEQLGSDHPYYLEPEDSISWSLAMEAWNKLNPGPDFEQEQKGLAYLSKAQITCGLQFAQTINESLI